MSFLAQKNPDFPTYRFFCNLSEKMRLGDLLCFGDHKWNLHSFTMSGQLLILLPPYFLGLVIGISLCILGVVEIH